MLQQSLKKFSEIFDKVQDSSTCHKKCLKNLENLYSTANFEDFCQHFLLILKQCFVLDEVNHNNPYIERTFSFCVSFCVAVQPEDDEDTCPFLSEILEGILKYLYNETAKYRVCQFLNLLLKRLGEKNCFLDENICDEIRESMLHLIMDPKKLIRLEAIEALSRLQDPQDQNDPIIKSYIECLSDTFPKIRKAIVKNIATNHMTVPVIITRCLDTDDGVRLVTYDKLSKLPMRSLSLVQRQRIIRLGLKDKNPRIPALISATLLPNWFKSCNGDYMKFISALKLDADENDFHLTVQLVEKILEIFFKSRPLSEIMEVLKLDSNKLIASSEAVLWELIVYWRCLIRFLQKDDTNTEYAEQIMPDLTNFCNFIRGITKTQANYKQDWELLLIDQIVLELFKMSQEFDFTDEVGRKTLQKLTVHVLTTTEALSKPLIEELVKILETICREPEELIKVTCLIITNVREPMVEKPATEHAKRKHEEDMAQLRMSRMDAISDKESAIEKQDYELAEEMQKKLDALEVLMVDLGRQFQAARGKTKVIKNDPETIQKCLNILIALLKSIRIQSLTPELLAFVDTLVKPFLMTNIEELQQLTFNALGLYCIIDEDLARDCVQILFTPLWFKKQQAQFGEHIIPIAIAYLTDIILSHGRTIVGSKAPHVDSTIENNTTMGRNRRRLFSKQQEESVMEEMEKQHSNVVPQVTLEEILEILSDLMDSDNNETRESAGKAIVKLISNGIVHSPTLFSKLLLDWFNPASDKNSYLQQLISVMFLDYIQNTPGSLEVAEKAFIPTIIALVDAPVTSPLADIDIDSMIRFMIELCRPNRHKYNTGLNTYKNLTFALVQEIGTPSKKKYVVPFLKALIHLELPLDDEAAIAELIKQANNMLEEIEEKNIVRYILKFKHKLEGNDDNMTATITETTTVDSTNQQAAISLNNSTTSRYTTLSVQKGKKRGKENASPAPSLDGTLTNSDSVNNIEENSVSSPVSSPRQLRKRICK